MKLATRVERLEAHQPPDLREWFWVVQKIGESEDSAKKRYEAESGKTIQPDDRFILWKIV